MIDTNKVVGFYTDVFGNEIDVYEQKAKYTISYKGYIFEGDSDGWNSRDEDSWEKAISVYDAYADEENDMYITDNEYGVTFHRGEWS